jgi:hypothetical protein
MRDRPYTSRRGRCGKIHPGFIRYAAVGNTSEVFSELHLPSVGRGSSVGIATRYGLDGPGGRIPVGARYSASVQTGPRVHPAFYTRGTGSYPGVTRPGRAVDHPPTSNAEVKERVELYLYSPTGPSWPVLR